MAIKIQKSIICFKAKKKNNNATGSLSGSEVKILFHSNIRNITVIVELTRTTE